MFCQLDRLRRCLSPRIQRALDEMPETLDETYERTLQDIDEENWAYAHRLFQCIVVARRPLRVEELADFLAFKSERGGSLKYEGNWRPENPREMVLSTCSSLIAIVTVDGSPEMQFSHFSVKEYLTSSRIAKGRVSRYYIPLEPAHLFVAQACLCFLLQLNKHVTQKSIQALPLARYAGQYWADHAEFGDVSSHTEDLIKRIFNPKNHHFANWVWIYDTISNISMNSKSPSRRSRRKFAPLHYAARHGFPRVVEWLITTCSQEVLGRNSTTPLHIASENEQFTAVQALLKHRADVNASDWFGNTPLHHVSRLGNHKIAQLLLKHGADVNAKTIVSQTPLLVSGNLEVAQLLLEHGADTSLRIGSCRESLYMALQNGHPGLAKLLLKHGANPNTRDVFGRTLLHVSSFEGDLKVAQRLLELDVDVNSRDNRGQTPLQVALQRGNEQVVQLLLQHGANRT